MKNYDIIIIGGGPSGIITGVTGKNQNPDKSFLMIKEEEKGLVPCGIPYIFHDLGSVDKNMMNPAPFVAAGGEVLVDSVKEVSFAQKKISTQTGTEFAYDKLVFATGSTVTEPKFIKGYDLQGVEYIRKSYTYVQALKAITDAVTNIVIVGGGFIGVEVAEQLAKFKDKNISLVEMQKHCLCAAFSEKLTEIADNTIREQGIHLYTSIKVTEIVGKESKVTAVKLSDGTELKADSGNPVHWLQNRIQSWHRKQDWRLTATMPLLQTTTCACLSKMCLPSETAPEPQDLSQAERTISLATATAEARIAGYNLFEIKLVRTFSGTLSVFSTEIGGKVFASAGAIKQACESAGIKYICGEFEDVDRHPDSIADASKLWVSLTVSPVRD